MPPLTEPKPEPLDCQSCAACCRDASDGRVLVSKDDLVRWRRQRRTDILRGLVPGHFGERGFAAKADGRCRHLGLAERPNDCAIYETRGDSCRRIEPGSSQCREYRRAYFPG